MLDKETVISLAEQYSDKVRAFVRPQKIVLYGSYAKGCSTPESDIDIAVIVDHVDNNYLAAVQQLYKIRRDISLDIEPVLLTESDNISGFLDDVLKNGIVIYDVRQGHNKQSASALYA